MDCQTESYIEVELLKDKKRFECEHCAQNPPANSQNQLEAQNHFPASEAVASVSVPVSDSVSETGIQLYEGEVLDIPLLPCLPETSPSPEMDEIFYAPIDDLNSGSLEEESEVVWIDDNPVNSEVPVPEIPQQLFSTFVPAVEASPQTPDSSHLQRLVEEPPGELQTAPKAVKVMTVKTSILMGVAVVFVLFIALGDKIIRPADKPSAQIEASHIVSPPKQDIQSTPAVASSAQPETAGPVQPEPAKPIPAPAAEESETKPKEVPPPTIQPPAVAAAEGQFTIQVGSHNNVGQANEQAEKLRTAGFEPRVVSVDIPKRGRWYRVQSGSFNDRVEANRYGAQVLAKGAAETFVISSQ